MAVVSFIQGIFLEIFTFLYPILRSHFVSYLIFLGLLIGLSRLISNIQAHYGSSSPKGGKDKGAFKRRPETFAKLTLYLIQGFVMTYIVWFIFIHFHTFQILSQGINNR